MSGFGLSRDISWDQNNGMEPRCCTTELICPVHGSIPTSSFETTCSVSTSFATRPLSLTPLFKYLHCPVRFNDGNRGQFDACTRTELHIIQKSTTVKKFEQIRVPGLLLLQNNYRVPAKCLDRLAISVMTKMRPNIESRVCEIVSPGND